MTLCLQCNSKVGPRRSKLVHPQSLFCSKACSNKFLKKEASGFFTPPPWLKWRPKKTPPPIDGGLGQWLAWMAVEVSEEINARAQIAHPFVYQEPPEVERARLLATLNLPSTATLEEAEKAYRNSARIVHPDAPGGDVQKMQALNARISRLRELLQPKAV